MGTVLSLLAPVFVIVVSVVFWDRFRALGGASLILLILVPVWAIWCLNYTYGVGVGWLATEFDGKRPYFFLIGPVVSGVVGIYAYCLRDRFLPTFLRGTAFFGFVLSIAYLGLYDPSDFQGRIGGDAGLLIGLAVVLVIPAVFGLAVIEGKFRLSYLLMLPLVAAAILLSGTRSLLVSSGAVVLLFVVLSLRSASRSRIVALSGLVIGIGLVTYLAALLGPEESVSRITTFEFGTTDDRWRLASEGLRILGEYPWGRALGISVELGDELEYVHNSTLDILIELGFVGGVFFALLVLLAIRGLLLAVLSRRPSPLIFIAVVVGVSSLSAGHAYNMLYWFVLLFYATAGLCAVLRVRLFVRGVSGKVGDQ